MKSMDFKNAITEVNCKNIYCGFNFKTYADSFRMIDENTQPLVILTKDNGNEVKALLDKLQFGERSAKRRLQKYSVSLKPYEFAELVKYGVICSQNGVDYLANEKFYDKDTGICFEDNSNTIY